MGCGCKKKSESAAQAQKTQEVAEARRAASIREEQAKLAARSNAK